MGSQEHILNMLHETLKQQNRTFLNTIIPDPTYITYKQDNPEEHIFRTKTASHKSFTA